MKVLSNIKILVAGFVVVAGSAWLIWSNTSSTDLSRKQHIESTSPLSAVIDSPVDGSGPGVLREVGDLGDSMIDWNACI